MCLVPGRFQVLNRWGERSWKGFKKSIPRMKDKTYVFIFCLFVSTQVSRDIFTCGNWGSERINKLSKFMYLKMPIFRTNFALTLVLSNFLLSCIATYGLLAAAKEFLKLIYAHNQLIHFISPATPKGLTMTFVFQSCYLNFLKNRVLFLWNV